jgi:hypothetical protein
MTAAMEIETAPLSKFEHNEKRPTKVKLLAFPKYDIAKTNQLLLPQNSWRSAI